MRSKASIKGHPIHPALIPFPIAFLVGAFFADLIGHLAFAPTIWTTGAYLAVAGVGMAVIAAVPGLIDYLFTVPPKSSGKRRATTHMIVNLSSVSLFVVALLIRGALDAQPSVPQLALEAVAVLLLSVGGWMGGTLAYRNQIGVDHRYAEAGKWKTVDFPASQKSMAVAGIEELEVNQMKLIRAGDKRIVLARTEDGFAAFDDHCTHKGGSLAGGTMMCGTVQCPWHGSQFDVNTGAVRAGPARREIGVYAIEQRGNEIWLHADRRISGAGIPLAASANRQVPQQSQELDMNIQELMTESPACVTPSDSLQRAAQLLADNDCGCLPVVENRDGGRVVGVITDRDIAVRGVAQGRSADTPVRDLMTTDVVTCRESDDVRELERLMADRQIRRVVVVDAAGSCVGIVSQADLALAAGRGSGVRDKEVARVVERISEPSNESLSSDGGSAFRSRSSGEETRL